MASLGEKAVGSIVKLNVSGTPREFIVVRHGRPSSIYDSSCDGVWLLANFLYTSTQFKGSSPANYAASSLHSVLNNNFAAQLDSAVLAKVISVKIPYFAPSGNSGTLYTGASGLAAKIFAPSARELGLTSIGSAATAEDGICLAYFEGASDAKRQARDLSGVASAYWTRSGRTNQDSYAVYVKSGGSGAHQYCNTGSYARAMFLLPYDINVDDSSFIDGSLSKGGIIGEVNIGGVMHKLTGEGFINKKGVLYPIILGSKVKIGSVLKDLLLGVEVKTSRLPDGYTEVEYIQFNNAPYIDTGMKLPSSFKMELGLTPMGSFGLIAGVQWSSPKFELTVWDNNMAYTTADTAFTGTTITPGSGKYDLVCTNNSYTVNGATETKTVSASNSTSYNLRIGAHGSGEIDSYRATMKLYYFRLYSAGTLVRDFVPCKNPSGTVGMYDLVNNKFYGNNGTGSLTAGAAV